jgi:outer membrane biogenesis lipoprotein LolB
MCIMMFFKRKLLPIIVVLLIACSAATALASTYVGNARTHKLHYADCRYVGEMNDSNKVYFEDRDEAIDEGYVPCKVCKP